MASTSTQPVEIPQPRPEERTAEPRTEPRPEVRRYPIKIQTHVPF